MGFFTKFFDALCKDFEEEVECTYTEAYRMKHTPSVKLVEPSNGRIIELRVTEPNETVATRYMNRLELYAKGLEEYGVTWRIEGKKISLTFSTSNMAERARQVLRG